MNCLVAVGAGVPSEPASTYASHCFFINRRRSGKPEGIAPTLARSVLESVRKQHNAAQRRRLLHHRSQEREKMKSGFRNVVTNALLAAAAVLGMTFATSASAVITGSAHDFSAEGYGSTQICIFCHAPHNNAGGTPLWNHAPTAATFTLYSSSTLNSTQAQPAGVSKLCLSCHDGRWRSTATGREPEPPTSPATPCSAPTSPTTIRSASRTTPRSPPPTAGW